MKTFLLVVILSSVVVSKQETTSEIVSANNVFTASTYKEAIKTGEENLLVSPLSAEIVLALTQSGAKGETAQELRSTLHLPDTEETTKASFKTFLQTLKSSKFYSLHTANKIYLGKSFSIKDEFRTSATDTYLSEIENIDFSQSDDAIHTINSWVEKQTNNKIKDLVDSSVINSGTLTVIVNALYFKAEWFNDHQSQFIVGTNDFYKINSTEPVKVDAMSKREAELNYYENSEIGAKFLEMPFNGDARMIVVLPFKKDGLPEVEKHAENIFKPHHFKTEIVDLTIPMFKIESTIDFKKILEKLGVKKAFARGQADFSGITGSKGDIAIDGVMQKTFINVDENGVEAAAATDLWVYMSGPPPATKTFNADHPFLFYITVNNVILFTGRVLSPSR